MGALVSFDADVLPEDIDRRVDWVGAFLVTTGLSLIVFVLGQAPSVGWKTPCMSFTPCFFWHVLIHS